MLLPTTTYPYTYTYATNLSTYCYVMLLDTDTHATSALCRTQHPHVVHAWCVLTPTLPATIYVPLLLYATTLVLYALLATHNHSIHMLPPQDTPGGCQDGVVDGWCVLRRHGLEVIPRSTVIYARARGMLVSRGISWCGVVVGGCEVVLGGGATTCCCCCGWMYHPLCACTHTPIYRV